MADFFMLSVKLYIKKIYIDKAYNAYWHKLRFAKLAPDGVQILVTFGVADVPIHQNNTS